MSVKVRYLTLSGDLCNVKSPTCKVIQYPALSSVIMRLPFLLLALLVNVAVQRKFSVVWTDDDELTFLTPEEHSVAFRDVIIEGMAERIFEVYMASSRQRDHSSFDKKILINDPQEIEDEIKFKKTETGLIDVDFRAWGLEVREEFSYFYNVYNMAALQLSCSGYFSLNILNLTPILMH